LFPAEPLDPLYEELQVGLDAPEIDSLGIRPAIERVDGRLNAASAIEQS
jgi:hypothetical protein